LAYGTEATGLGWPLLEITMRPRSPALLHRVIAVAAVIGFALPASAALAQAGQVASPGAGPSESQNVSPDGNPESDAATAKPASVGGVIVQAPRPEAQPPIPADKRAAYDAEVAKSEAWKRYRKSIPSTNVGTLEQADDYPGLQSLLPPP
jgi:hypothetical protein